MNKLTKVSLTALCGSLATLTGVTFGIFFSYYIEEIRILITTIFNIKLFPEEIYFLNQMPSEINIKYILIISFFSLLIITSLTLALPSVAIVFKLILFIYIK